MEQGPGSRWDRYLSGLTSASGPDSPRSQQSRGTIGSLGAVQEHSEQQWQAQEELGRTAGRGGMRRLTRHLLTHA
jgi:hypothetical protein